MIWTVTYRNKNGKTECFELEATNREEVLKELQVRGISAVRVEQGCKEKKKKTPSSSKVTISAVVGLLIILIVTIAFLILPKKGQLQSEKSGIKETIKQKRVEKSANKKPVKQVKTQEVKPVEKNKPKSGFYTNENGRVFHIDKDGTRSQVSRAWLRRREELKKNPPRRVFKHTSEGYLSMFLNPAVSVPPPPENYTDEQVQAMLLNKIEIDTENDTEDEIRQKEGVIAMKEELRDWIKNGGTFSGYLKELQSRQEAEAIQMHEARKMINESMENGNVEEAKLLYEKINEHFAEKHMPPVNIAPKYRRLFERNETK